MGCGASTGGRNSTHPPKRLVKKSLSEGLQFEGEVNLKIPSEGWKRQYIVLRDVGVIEFFKDPELEQFTDGMAIFKVVGLEDAEWNILSIKSSDGKEFSVSFIDENQKKEWTKVIQDSINNIQQLYEFISEGSLDSVKELIDKKGASPVCRFKELCLPIHIAAKQGSLPIIKYLIHKGADPNEIDVSGRNSLHWAAESGKTEVVQFLLDSSTSFKSDFNGRNPLDCIQPDDQKTAAILVSHVPQRRHENNLYGFEMMFPERWVEMPEHNNPLCLIKCVPEGYPKGEVPLQELKIIVEDLSKYPHKIAIGDYFEIFKRSMKQVPNVMFEFLEERKTELAGQEARALTLKLEIPTDTIVLTLKLLNYCVVHKGKAFIVVYSADISEWSKGSLLADKCIATFQFMNQLVKEAENKPS